MQDDIQTLLEGAQAHLKFAELRYSQGDLEKALDQVAATQIYLPDLETLMIAQVDRNPDAILAKTVKRADGEFDLLIRQNAEWRRLGIAKDDVDLGRLITVCGYKANVSSIPYKSNVMRYFGIVRLEDQDFETSSQPANSEEAAHV